MQVTINLKLLFQVDGLKSFKMTGREYM